MLKNQAGFTLIELVMVIILLGILAAVAIPKYQDLTTEARTAAFKGGLGAIKSARLVAIAKNLGVTPSLTTLISAVEGGVASAGNGGLTIVELKKASGALYIFKTYSGTITDYSTCAGGTQTSAATHTVECIACENTDCAP